MANQAHPGDIRLLALEDIPFVASGGIETVISALLPELDAICGEVVLALPEYKLCLRKKLVSQGTSIRLESLKPPAFTPGWVESLFASFCNRVIGGTTLSRVATSLTSRAKSKRIRHLIKTYGLTHILNLALFDQDPPKTDLPLYPIVHDINYSPQWEKRCRANLERWAHCSSALVTVSSCSRDEILGYLHSKRHAPVVAIPLSVSMESIKRRPSPQHRSSSIPITFLYPASLGAHKNHATLLRALTKVHRNGHDFVMVFCGLGTDHLISSTPNHNSHVLESRDILQNACTPFIEKLQILGEVSQESLEDLYRKADYVLLPTTYEGFGLPLLEAISRKIPVICSNLPTFVEQVRAYRISNGVTMISENTDDAWAKAISEVIEHPICCSDVPNDISETLSSWRWSDVAMCYANTMLRFSPLTPTQPHGE